MPQKAGDYLSEPHDLKECLKDCMADIWEQAMVRSKQDLKEEQASRAFWQNRITIELDRTVRATSEAKKEIASLRGQIQDFLWSVQRQQLPLRASEQVPQLASRQPTAQQVPRALERQQMLPDAAAAAAGGGPHHLPSEECFVQQEGLPDTVQKSALVQAVQSAPEQAEIESLGRQQMLPDAATAASGGVPPRLPCEECFMQQEGLSHTALQNALVHAVQSAVEQAVIESHQRLADQLDEMQRLHLAHLDSIQDDSRMDLLLKQRQVMRFPPPSEAHSRSDPSNECNTGDPLEQLGRVSLKPPPWGMLPTATAGTPEIATHARRLETAQANRSRSHSVPRELAKTTRLCKFWVRGSCTLNKTCQFSHDPEARDKCRTKLCRWWKEGLCLDGELCVYAHGQEKLRSVVPREDLRKTKMCRFANRTCPNGDLCTYAHSLGELRKSSCHVQHAAPAAISEAASTVSESVNLAPHAAAAASCIVAPAQAKVAETINDLSYNQHLGVVAFDFDGSEYGHGYITVCQDDIIQRTTHPDENSDWSHVRVVCRTRGPHNEDKRDLREEGWYPARFLAAAVMPAE